MRRGRPGRRVATVLAWPALAALGLLAPTYIAAQTLTGLVVDESNELPVPGAQVLLLDEGGEGVLSVEADSVGRYAFRVPRPGAFVLAAARIGYEEGRTPLLDLSFEGTRTLDLVVTPRPVALAGFEVTASARGAEEALERELRHYGVAPGQLPTTRIVTTEEIEAVAAARDFGHVLARQNIAGLEVIRGDYPDELLCIVVARRSGCAVIVIDGAIAPIDRAGHIPAGAFETIVVLKPHEAGLLFGTQADGGGAVMLFSRGTIRR